MRFSHSSFLCVLVVSSAAFSVRAADGYKASPASSQQPGAPQRQQHRANRSLEYDSLGDAYARFLLEEIIPEVSEEHDLTKDPAGWTVCGNNSEGICTFTTAWERPDRFGKVVSHIGSFTNIRGGYVYPFLIRKTKEDGVGAPDDQAKVKQRRKIRVFLQDGSGDLDNDAGNWPPANQEIAAALKFAGWNCRFMFGTGGHDHNQPAAVFPDTMRRLWRDYAK